MTQREMDGDFSLVERYRKCAEEIRAFASAMANSEERATLLQIADEYDRAAITQEIRSHLQRTMH